MHYGIFEQMNHIGAKKKYVQKFIAYFNSIEVSIIKWSWVD